MWECGLKPCVTDVPDNARTSLLMWECGLKHFSVNIILKYYSHSLCGSVD